jgi:hypothetical protein
MRTDNNGADTPPSCVKQFDLRHVIGDLISFCSKQLCLSIFPYLRTTTCCVLYFIQTSLTDVRHDCVNLFWHYQMRSRLRYPVMINAWSSLQSLIAKTRPTAAVT